MNHLKGGGMNRATGRYPGWQRYNNTTAPGRQKLPNDISLHTLSLNL